MRWPWWNRSRLILVKASFFFSIEPAKNQYNFVLATSPTKAGHAGGVLPFNTRAAVFFCCQAVKSEKAKFQTKRRVERGAHAEEGKEKEKGAEAGPFACLGQNFAHGKLS